MSDDSAYAAIVEHNDEARWAFGTGFADPLAGVDTSIPAHADVDALAAQCLALGDDALIMSHRLSEWVYRAPELEEETALANVALDLLGQARLLLSRAGQLDGTGRDEDALAFRRDAAEFTNVTLAELPNGDFADCIARLLVFATWRLSVMAALRESDDPVLAAIAAKAVTELTYHREYAADWTVRLGDGTVESADRMAAAVGRIAAYVGELDPGDDVLGSVDDVLAAATLDELQPDAGSLSYKGRDGRHTDALAPLLAEMQGVAREHPDATW